MKKILSLLKLKSKILASYIAVNSGALINTDTSTFITVSHPSFKDIAPGQYDKEGLKLGLFNKVGDIDNFPNLPELTGKHEEIIINSDQVLKMIPFTANKSEIFRQHMQGIYFDAEQMVATDGRTLAWLEYPHKQEIKESFTLDSKAAKLIPKNTELNISASKEYVSIGFRVGEYIVHIISRKVDAKFPDYKAVIPNIDNSIVETCISLKDIDFDKLLYAANKSTKMAKVCINGSIKLRSEDLDLNKEFEQDIKAPVKWKQPNSGEIEIGVNLDNLKKCMEFYKDPVIISVINDSKPIHVGNNIICITMSI